MTDEEFMKATAEGNIPMDKDEIAQLLADRDEARNKPAEKSLAERVADLEVKVNKLSK